MRQVVLPSMFDAHVHFRHGPIMAPLIRSHVGVDAVLAMPNTSPPVTRVFRTEETPEARSIEGYRGEIVSAGGDRFATVMVALYLTRETTPATIEAGARAGVLTSCKSYPPKGTTNSEFAVGIRELMASGVVDAMSDHGVVLNVHGERHGLPGRRWLGRSTNAETVFYDDEMEDLVSRYPRLRVVCEHVSTERAVAFVRSKGPGVVATVTPQHLHYTRGDLVQGWFSHLNCMPTVKDEEDMEALRAASVDADTGKFFAGTDSAPHPRLAKSMDCGCAAGCFTNGVAPQMYAQAFEEYGVDLFSDEGRGKLSRFLSGNGRAFYGLPDPTGRIVLTREPQEVRVLPTDVGEVVPLPVGLLRDDGAPRVATIPWRMAA